MKKPILTLIITVITWISGYQVGRYTEIIKEVREMKRATTALDNWHNTYDLSEAGRQEALRTAARYRGLLVRCVQLNSSGSLTKDRAVQISNPEH